MRHILVADDEPLQRQGLAQMIRQLRPECTVFEAEDGQQAKALFDNGIHMVFTDIRMPHVDGLELVKWVREAHCDLPVALVSAYDEFAYARQALSMGVCDYLLKPVRRNDLEAVLGQMEQRLEDGQRRRQDRLSANREERRKNRQETTAALAGWLEGRLPEAEARALLTAQGMPVRGRISACMPLGSPLEEGAIPPGELLLSVRESWEEREPDSRAWLVPVRHVRIGATLALLSGEGLQHSDIEALWDDMLADTRNHAGRMLSVGLADKVCDLAADAPRLLHDALRAARQGFCDEGGNCLYRGDDPAFTEALPHGFETMAEPIVAAFRRMEEAAAAQGIDDYVSEMALHRLDPLYVREELGLMLRRALYHHAQTLDGRLYADLSHQVETAVHAGCNLGELRESLRALNEYLFSMLRGQPQQESALLLRITNYMHDTPLATISLRTVADTFGYAPTYFSRIFKEQYGLTFSDYLSQLRMQRARELLEDRRHKVSEVAEIVGLREVRYFSRLFKERYGLSPDEYRRRPQ